MNEEIKIHDNQSVLEDYLKEENSNCLKCEDYRNEKCESISCDYYGMTAKDIDVIFCIHKPREDSEGTLLDELY